VFDAVAAQLGPAALAALAGVIDIHKRDDALAPVTIVVPANSVGVAVRRRLARRGHGIAGVTFVTLYRLAELLGGADLAASGRQPVSNPILAAAARVALHTRPGRFAPVADHPSTELALVRAHRELDDLDAAALDRLARASGRAHDLVTLHRAMRAALAPAFSTERDLLDAASAVVASAPAARATLGAVVVYLPTTLSAPKRRLLEALMAGGAVTLVVGLTGDPTLDRDPIGVAADLGAALQVPDVAAPVASHVVSVSDPDDEARVVVRRIIDAARLGVPLERIAVVFARRDPYARLLHEHLDAAGIPHNGVAVRRLADSVAGRTLVRALALGDRDLRRGDVLAFAAGTPVRSGGRSVPAAAWERISRAAGVVAGAAQWRDRLARYRATLDDDSPEAERADGLAEFVSHLDERLQRLRRAHTWRELGAIAREILRAHLPGDHARASWSDEEQRATDKVELAIDRLATLDPVERAIGGARTPGVDLASFRRALDAELDADLGRVGRLGEGVLVGSVHLASGVELDEVYVVGLAEGSFPARWRDDSLLPDRDRAAVGDALPDRRARADADHRALLAVLAHTSGRRVFLHPRGDLRRTTDRPPSRHALDSIEALAGVRPRAGELAALAAGAGHGWFEFSPSFTAGVAATAFPATDQERRIAALLHDRATRASLAAHPLVVADRALRRGVELLLARASSEFTRFDGNLCGRPVPRLTDGVAVVSATALQRYARCPLEYLLDQILRVRMVEDPDDIERIGALDLGQIYHLALERFLAEQLASGAPAPHEPWSAAQRASLLAHARAVCDEFVAGGLTGRPVFWRYDRRRVLDDLDRFLDDDDCERRERGRTPIAAELRFGVKGAAHGPVELPLADGRTLRLRGSADRVDRTAGGGFVVIDYKTGAAGGFTDLDEANPDGNGCYLQLPIYAHATRVCHGRPDAPVEAAYRFVTQRGGYTTVAVPLTDTVADRVDHVLATIVDLIESGTFPCRMDPPDTSPFRFPSLVDPDGRSQGDRAREWQRKRAAPSLARYLALAEPDTPVALAAPGVG
jgi:RecB family exonuclease